MYTKLAACLVEARMYEAFTQCTYQTAYTPEYISDRNNVVSARLTRTPIVVYFLIVVACITVIGNTKRGIGKGSSAGA
jgi:hypothetical protein